MPKGKVTVDIYEPREVLTEDENRRFSDLADTFHRWQPYAMYTQADGRSHVFSWKDGTNTKQVIDNDSKVQASYDLVMQWTRKANEKAKQIQIQQNPCSLWFDIQQTKRNPADIQSVRHAWYMDLHAFIGKMLPESGNILQTCPGTQTRPFTVESCTSDRSSVASCTGQVLCKSQVNPQSFLVTPELMEHAWRSLDKLVWQRRVQRYVDSYCVPLVCEVEPEWTKCTARSTVSRLSTSFDHCVHYRWQMSTLSMINFLANEKWSFGGVPFVDRLQAFQLLVEAYVSRWVQWLSDPQPKRDTKKKSDNPVDQKGEEEWISNQFGQTNTGLQCVKTAAAATTSACAVSGESCGRGKSKSIDAKTAEISKPTFHVGQTVQVRKNRQLEPARILKLNKATAVVELMNSSNPQPWRVSNDKLFLPSC